MQMVLEGFSTLLGMHCGVKGLRQFEKVGKGLRQLQKVGKGLRQVEKSLRDGQC
jgi:hypothetical protein